MSFFDKCFRLCGDGKLQPKICTKYRKHLSLNTQFCIKGHLVVWDFCLWAVCAARPVRKKWGPIMSNFWVHFFHVFGVNIIASLLTSCIINLFFLFVLNFFWNTTVFFLDCAHSQMWMYHIKISYCRTRHLDLKKLCVFQLSGQIDPCLAGLKFLWVKLKYATFEGDSFMFSWTKKMKIRVSVHGTWERPQ